MLYKGTIFKNRKFNFEKLKEFGFIKKSEFFVYKTSLADNSFELTVKLFKDETIDTKIIEISTKEEYGLVYVKGAEGGFVGKIKDELENVLIEIKDKCTEFNVFKSEHAYKIIEYIEKKYKDKPEYLWEKFPNNAIFRRNDKKGKWYAAILTAKKESVGIKGGGEIEIIDLKADPDEILKIVDNKKYFKGYHMNKKHWFTICLDGTVGIKEIFEKIDSSYNSI